MRSDWIDLKRKIGNFAGARDAFEDACVDIYQQKFPDKHVRGIRLNPGDGGIDISVGLVGIEPIDVYQCKYFIDGIKKSQKDQIKKSFKAAIENDKYELNRWFLCLPIDLDIDETIWFNKWITEQEVEIKLISGSMLLTDSKKLGLYDLIFEHEDSLRIKALHDHVLNSIQAKGGKPTFTEFVRRAEKDCFRLLQSIIHYHIAEFGSDNEYFNGLHSSTMNGDYFSACQYIKSVLSANTSDKQKTSIYLILNDYSQEPVAHKYLKRYEALLLTAEQDNFVSEVEHSMFNDVYKLLKSEFFAKFREKAYWKVYI